MSQPWKSTAAERRRVVAALIEAGRRLDHLGLVPARDGNVSARFGSDHVVISATQVRKRELTPETIVEVDLEGRVTGPGRASTELGMHLAIYRKREDVGAVVHAHPPAAVGFACAGLGLTDCLMPEVVVGLGAVPLTPYATPGTPELEAAISRTVEDHDAFLLANHGAVTLGASVDQALDRMETLEHFARIALVAELLGGGRPLAAGDLPPLEATRLRMGVSRPITCDPAPGSPALAARESTPSSAPDPEAVAEAVAQALRSLLGPSPRG